MGQKKVHLSQYETFRKDAMKEDVSENLRIEAMFLAAYHLIDACAANLNVHIGKHQNVRRELELNTAIFGQDTQRLWHAFQDLESRVRPKFVYGQSWSRSDFERGRELFIEIERICQRVLSQ